MMEPVRDLDNHLICCVDTENGLIEHIHQKEMVRISLPVGGEVLFARDDSFTVVRRINLHNMYVTSERDSEFGFFGS